MNELVTKGIIMNHVELCELINKLREEEGNRKELLSKNLLAKIRKEVETMKTLGVKDEEYFIKGKYKDKSGKTNPTFLITIKGLEWLRDNNIHDVKAYHYAIKMLDPNYKVDHINIASTAIRKEVLINKILLAWFEEGQIKSQYPVLSYRLDYYIPDCYLVIEYNEATGHKDIEKDNKRKEDIINYLYWNDFAKNSNVSYDEVKLYENRKEDVIEFIIIKEFEEEKGLNELFEFLTGDVKWLSKLKNLNR